MSKFLDRFRYFKQKGETFADGHVKVECMEVGASVRAKIAVDLFPVQRTDKVEAMAVLC